MTFSLARQHCHSSQTGQRILKPQPPSREYNSEKPRLHDRFFVALDLGQLDIDGHAAMGIRSGKGSKRAQVDAGFFLLGTGSCLTDGSLSLQIVELMKSNQNQTDLCERVCNV